MTKEEQKSTGISLNLDSKFLRTFLIVVAALLIFVGPTYGVYAAQHVLKFSYLRSMGGGAVLFIVGLVLLLYLIRKGVVK